MVSHERPAERTKHQSEIRTISRMLIANAKYNPRTIDPAAKRKLRKSLEKFGLAGTPVWNQATGNLVGGHQRISLLDDIEGTDDYQIDVSVVTLSEKKEKELNIMLNNQSAMGQWDVDKIELLLPEIDIASAGFEAVDLEMMFADAGKDSTFLDSLYTAEGLQVTQQAQNAVNEALDESDAAKEAMLQRRKDFKDKAAQQNDSGYMVTMVFSDSGKCAEFLEKYGWDRTADMIDGHEFDQSVEEYIDEVVRGPEDEQEAGEEGDEQSVESSRRHDTEGGQEAEDEPGSDSRLESNEVAEGSDF